MVLGNAALQCSRPQLMRFALNDKAIQVQSFGVKPVSLQAPGFSNAMPSGLADVLELLELYRLSKVPTTEFMTQCVINHVSRFAVVSPKPYLRSTSW